MGSARHQFFDILTLPRAAKWHGIPGHRSRPPIEHSKTEGHINRLSPWLWKHGYIEA